MNSKLACEMLLLLQEMLNRIARHQPAMVRGSTSEDAWQGVVQPNDHLSKRHISLFCFNVLSNGKKVASAM